MIVVTGHGRCGSTLMMRMLYEAGMSVYCEQDTLGRSFECTMSQKLPQETSWLNEIEDNTAVKILRPTIYRPPRGFDYKFIHMIRNPVEQAKSRCKLLKADGLGVRKLHESIKRIRSERAHTRRLLQNLGEWTELRFEDQITGDIDHIANWLKLDADAMRTAIIPRGPECYDGFIENVLREATTH